MTKRANFTLIELLIVLSLIALATATLQFSFTNFSYKKRMDQELCQLKNTLYWAQDLMISSQISSKVVFKQGEDEILVEFVPQAPIEMKIIPFKSKTTFKRIKSIAFNDQKAKEITLHFDAHLGCISQGVLTLVDKNDQEHHFKLKGFPSRLHA